MSCDTQVVVNACGKDNLRYLCWRAGSWEPGERGLGAGSWGLGAGSRELGAGSLKLGVGSREM